MVFVSEAVAESIHGRIVLDMVELGGNVLRRLEPSKVRT